MPIRVVCPSCERSFELDEKFAGKLGRCLYCKDPVRVPRATAEAEVRPESDSADGSETYGLASETAGLVSARVRAAKAARVKTQPDPTPEGDRAVALPRTQPRVKKRSSAEILAAFRGEIRPVRPTMLYRVWIVIIAVVMMILPMVYLALVVAVGYAVYWHAVHNVVIFQNVRNIRASLLLYGSPLAAGLVVLGFMLKPLFARSGKQSKVRQIDPNKEPLIVAFVDGVCQSVHAPTPSRIEVDCQVNASAHLASWVFSPSKELVLTIGLPLIEGLTLRQFTGVLAHEFGHFSQGAGMRLNVLIRSINRWFARVVYERDEWDEMLKGWFDGGNGAIIVVVLIARGAIWVTRRILWVLMHVGHLVSGFLSRQMEFDADRYQTRMVGATVFESTMLQVNELGYASNAAHSDLAESWRERRLPDDMSRLIQVKFTEFSDPLRTAIRDSALSAKTGRFDTHPCDAERIARAKAESTEGIFHLDGPATDLFRNFESLSRSTTFDYYRAVLGREVTKDQLYPVAEAILNKEVEREGYQAIDRFFLGAWQLVQPIPLVDTYPKPPADPKAAKRRLGELRRVMMAERSSNLAMAEYWGEANQQATHAEAALSLFKADKKVKPGVVHLSKATVGAAETALAAATTTTERAMAGFEPFGTAAAERLGLALGLLELDIVVGRVPDGVVLRDEARSLYPTAVVLGGRVVAELSQFVPAINALGFLINLYQAGKNDKDQAMINALLRGTRHLHDRLTQIKWKIGDSVAYPFEHAHEGMTIGRFLLPTLPDSQDVGGVVQTASETHDRLVDLHRRVLGRLTATAEAVERAIGLPPIEIPPPATLES